MTHIKGRCGGRFAAWVLFVTTQAALGGWFAPAAQAQWSITGFGSNFVIDFDTSVPGVNNGAYSGFGFNPAPGAGQLDSDAWSVSGLSDGTALFGGSAASGDFARGTTGTNVGTTTGLYAFTGVNITTGRTFGIAPSDADFTPGALTLKLRNNTGGIIQSLTVTYTLYARNDLNNSTSFNFQHSADHVTYSAAMLNLNTPTTGSGSNPFALLGTPTTTLTGLSIAPGADYYFQWRSSDVSGVAAQRDELALDNITVNATGIFLPEPAGLVLLGALSLALLVRRRTLAA